MDQEMQDKIDLVEWVCRGDLAAGDEASVLDPQEILDIFAAFRLEIIKAGGRNA